MIFVQADVVIVGAGSGGATLAKELSEKGKKVILIDKGSVPEQKGTHGAAASYYEPCISKEGLVIDRALVVGGSTQVSVGNGVRALEKELHSFGIDLNEEFREAEKELNVAHLEDRLVGRGTKRLMDASRELGYNMKLMPKFIDPRQCTSCGRCSLGCPLEAKWTAQRYVNQAIEHGAKLITNMTVTRAITSNGVVKGVRGIGPAGEQFIKAQSFVVLSAGGIGTPIILQKSGIKAGEGLFVDAYASTYGVTTDVGMVGEISMAALIDQFYETKGFILSPHTSFAGLDFSLDLTNVFRLPRKLLLFLLRKHVLGIMTKIRDECTGKVHENGKIEKTISSVDADKLDEGTSIAKKILVEAGANPRLVWVTKPSGAHPGGTASIGKVVDTNQETEVKGLFVSDASVLPTSPGLPLILTIVALSKRLAKKLVQEYT